MSEAIPIQDSDERSGLPSASATSQWMRCQGQPQMVRSLPPRDEAIESSPEATRGTRLHSALETRNPMLLEDEGESAAFKQALHNQDVMLQQWQSELGIETAIEGERELRLWLWSQDGSEPIVSGKMDTHWIEAGTRSPCVIIQDYKSGSGIGAGDAATNDQLRTLAVLVKYEYNARRVRVVLNCFESFGQQLRVCDYDEAALAQAEYMVRFHLWLTTLPNAPRTPGPQCWYCPAAGLCPENAAMTMLPTVATKGILEQVDSLSPADLKKLWEVDGQIRKTLDRVSYRLANLPPEDLASVGLYLGKPKETDKILDVPGVVARLKERGLLEADILTCAKLGKGELVKLLRREFALSSDVKAETWIEKNLGEFIETSEGARTLKEIKT